MIVLLGITATAAPVPQIVNSFWPFIIELRDHRGVEPGCLASGVAETLRATTMTLVLTRRCRDDQGAPGPSIVT